MMAMRYVNYDALMSCLKDIEDGFRRDTEKYGRVDDQEAEYIRICGEVLTGLANSIGLVEFVVEQPPKRRKKRKIIKLLERKVKRDGKKETHDS